MAVSDSDEGAVVEPSSSSGKSTRLQVAAAAVAGGEESSPTGTARQCSANAPGSTVGGAGSEGSSEPRKPRVCKYNFLDLGK